MKKVTLFLFFFVFVQFASSQFITGRIFNSEQKAIERATVVVQTVDSVFLNAGITNTEGKVRLKSSIRPYHLVIQHIAYRTKERRDSCTVRYTLGGYKAKETKKINISRMDL